MDKNAIKKYAVWARRELISRVSQRAAIYGITDEGYDDPNAGDINGKILTSTEISRTGASDLIMQGHINSISTYVPALVKQAKMLVQEYEVVVTNPPYMGGSGMSAKLSEYVKDNYP